MTDDSYRSRLRATINTWCFRAQVSVDDGTQAEDDAERTLEARKHLLAHISALEKNTEQLNSDEAEEIARSVLYLMLAAYDLGANTTVSPTVERFINRERTEPARAMNRQHARKTRLVSVVKELGGASWSVSENEARLKRDLVRAAMSDEDKAGDYPSLETLKQAIHDAR
jgi:hypothetical protein